MSRPKSRGCEVVNRTRRIPGNLPDGSQQFSKDFLPCRIFIGIHVLAEQLNFGVSQVRHLARFCQHRIRGPAALLATRKGHNAVGAKLVAAFDDRDVSAMGIRARREFGFKALVGLRGRSSPGSLALVFPPPSNLHQHLWQVAVRRRSAHQRHMRRALENLFAFLLRHAPEHAELLALRLQFLVIGQAMKDLLLRLVANGAGVVEDQIRLSTVSTWR